ncbi:MAG: zinc-dependent metalloprotease [Chitinophagaceae bacterium]|nr:zinc-dependent metalloprotease [Chitinophagaceae bacterium]
MHKVLLLLILSICSLKGFNQALYQVGNSEKERNSSLIVEGKVIDQTSFWNATHTMIYTSNKIKVYKIFKGQLTADYVEVLTQGGNVGEESIAISDLAELEKDEIGVFFCYPNTYNLRSGSGNILFDIYAGAQGFIKYNVEGNKATCPFNHYSSITHELYPLLKYLTGQDYVVKDGSLIIGNTGSLLYRGAAFISSFSPTTVNAGATSDPGTNLLTITGTGFGTPGGTAAIKFSDANAGVGSGVYYTVNSGSNLIVSWTDTEIKVRVPSRAGSGTIIVRDATGNENISFELLSVFYSILEGTVGGVVKQLNLINANGKGGYDMLYSTTMTPEITVTFNRALKTWIDLSGFNVVDGGTTGIARAASDGNCVVFLDNAENGTPLPAGVLAACYTYTNACTPTTANPFRRPEFDIIIRSSFSTGTVIFTNGPCPPASNVIDLETVLLHELGHALNLGHINDAPEGSGVNRNPPKLMYYAVSNGVKRNSPDASAYEGSIYTCSTNGSINFGSCTAIVSHTQKPILRDSKDECPLFFPISPTPQGTQLNFDLEHATSNSKRDPQFTNLTCNFTGTNVTNNLYYVFRTDAAGSLSILVADFVPYPSPFSECSGTAPTIRLALYQVNSCPDGQNFPAAINCRNFSGNGVVDVITGLAANTNYLMYIDGGQNAKATFKLILGGNALPIKLESFTGEIKGKLNEVRWKIASYVDVKNIVLEKSADGIEFKSLKNYVTNITTGQEYVVNDNLPFAGNNFYRLATFNKDGTVQYSKIVLLKRKETIKFNIYPNPVADHINIIINSVENVDKISIRIYNNLGQLLYNRTSGISNGITNVGVNTGKMSAGTYRLVVSDKNNQILERLVFQKL